MNKLKSPVPLWLGYPLLFVLGIGTGMLAVGYAWSKSGYQLLPPEIVITPPPPATTWCFPNTSLRGATAVRTLLADQLQGHVSTRQADSLRVIDAIRQVNEDSRMHSRLLLLRQQGKRYEIISFGLHVGAMTLATEQGSFYLHRVSQRFHPQYDSLAAIR